MANVKWLRKRASSFSIFSSFLTIFSVSLPWVSLINLYMFLFSWDGVIVQIQLVTDQLFVYFIGSFQMLCGFLNQPWIKNTKKYYKNIRNRMFQGNFRKPHSCKRFYTKHSLGMCGLGLTRMPRGCILYKLRCSNRAGNRHILWPSRGPRLAAGAGMPTIAYNNFFKVFVVLYSPHMPHHSIKYEKNN